MVFVGLAIVAFFWAFFPQNLDFVINSLATRTFEGEADRDLAIEDKQMANECETKEMIEFKLC